RDRENEGEQGPRCETRHRASTRHRQQHPHRVAGTYHTNPGIAESPRSGSVCNGSVTSFRAGIVPTPALRSAAALSTAHRETRGALGGYVARVFLQIDHAERALYG